jgi:hypothetical protein
MREMVRCVHDVVAHLLGPPLRRRLRAPRPRGRHEKTDTAETHGHIMSVRGRLARPNRRPWRATAIPGA